MLEASSSPIHNTKTGDFSIMSESIYTYYVYAYIRSKDSITAKAGTPYYIGKGKGKRIYGKHFVPVPKDKRYIVILESNLSNIGALALERRYIRWYGRKDNNTGILRNLTDGGEGKTNIIVSKETRHKISNSNKGKKRSEEQITNIKEGNKSRSYANRFGRVHTEETKKKMSDSAKGKSKSEEHCLNISKGKKGKPLSEEHKQNLSNSKRGKARSEETKRKISESMKKRKLQTSE